MIEMFRSIRSLFSMIRLAIRAGSEHTSARTPSASDAAEARAADARQMCSSGRWTLIDVDDVSTMLICLTVEYLSAYWSISTLLMSMTVVTWFPPTLHRDEKDAIFNGSQLATCRRPRKADEIDRPLSGESNVRIDSPLFIWYNPGERVWASAITFISDTLRTLIVQLWSSYTRSAKSICSLGRH